MSRLKKRKIWKVIPNFPDYEVDKNGNIRRITSGINTYPGRLIKPRIDRCGYKRVSLRKDNKDVLIFVHRLVLETFVGPCPEGYQCNHKDGVKSNNHLTNLEWVTNKTNMNHARKNGLLILPKGEKHYRSKLTQKEVDEIRSSYKSWKITMQKLSDDYNVSMSAIQSILEGRTWKESFIGEKNV